MGWVHWFNHQRLHSKIGYVPPVDHKNEHYRQNRPAQQPLPGEPALH